MQKGLREMALVRMTQVESLIKIAELAEPKSSLKLEGVAEEVELVREKYVTTWSEVQEQLQNVLQQIREKSPAPELDAKLTQAIDRLEELKKPYV